MDETQPQQATGSMAGIIGKAIGLAANGVIEVIDIDGVVRRVNINETILKRLSRDDVNRFLDKVDWDALLDNVDIQRQVDRIDFNRVLARVDTSAIVASSTTGIFTEILDSLRRHVTILDVWLYQAASWLLRRNVGLLPPAPRQGGEETEVPKPRGRSAAAIAMQGRYTGIVSKGLALGIDTLVIMFTFAGLLIFAGLAWMMLSDETEQRNFKRDQNIYTAVIFMTYWFLYFFVSTLLTGRTFGMAVVGIKVVDNKTARSVSILQALVRTAILPLSSGVAMFLVLIGILRKDGRMLHDIVASTAIIYRWDARTARVRARLNGEESESFTSQSSSPEDPLNHYFQTTESGEGQYLTCQTTSRSFTGEQLL